jgi:hypothetical protein
MLTPDHFQLNAAPSASFRRKRRNGYAGRPGSGPKGETCKSCKNHARIRLSKTIHKCELMREHWTGSYGTDVKVAAPACRHWEKPDAPR